MRCLLLDFDGPLIDFIDLDSGRAIATSITILANRFKLDISTTQGTSSFFLAWAAARAQIPSKRRLRYFDRCVHEIIKEHELLQSRSRNIEPLTAYMLRNAHLKFARVAIVTNTSTCAVSSWLHNNNVADYIDYISGRDSMIDFSMLKPSPYLLLRAIGALQCDPAQSLFCGDTLSDYKCASNSNVPFIGIKTIYSPSDLIFSHVTNSWIADSREQLMTYLLTNGR